MNFTLLNISDLNTENAIVALVGIAIVFLALTILYLSFSAIPKIMDWYHLIKMKKKNGPEELKMPDAKLSSEVNAAIGAALYLYFGEIHDEENTIMTIKKVSKTYSPWSSKLYSMRWPLR